MLIVGWRTQEITDARGANARAAVIVFIAYNEESREFSRRGEPL